MGKEWMNRESADRIGEAAERDPSSATATWDSPIGLTRRRTATSVTTMTTSVRGDGEQAGTGCGGGVQNERCRYRRASSPFVAIARDRLGGL